jgi:hypothetical protein
MATTAADVIETVHKSLEPYIRARHEVAEIRRLLSEQLHSRLGAECTTVPLALTNAAITRPVSGTKGLLKEYLDAIHNNLKARMDFETARRPSPPTKESSCSIDSISTTNSILADHLSTIKMRKKHDKLKILEDYIARVDRQIASSTDFLEPKEIFKGALPIPDLPGGAVKDWSLEGKDSGKELSEMARQLEKTALRAKMLLTREEESLADVRSRLGGLPETISVEAKSAALSATRGELIAWIERELSSASNEGREDDDDDNNLTEAHATRRNRLDEQLSSMKNKYAAYVSCRKSILHMTMGEWSTAKLPQLQATANLIETGINLPTTYLIIPYLGELLSVAHEQKGLITQKAHLNVSLTKQLKDTCQIIDHLTGESQLLPKYPQSGSSKRKQGVGEGLTAPETMDLTSRTKPWVFAADSAKIATLESVAEQVEDGQLGLEESMKLIGEAGDLLGRPGQEQQDAVEDPSDQAQDDIWLSQATATSTLKPQRRIGKADAKGGKHGDVWAKLDGKLGLIRPIGST